MYDEPATPFAADCIGQMNQWPANRHCIHIHLAQRIREVEACERLWGMRPVAWLESPGFFEQPVSTVCPASLSPHVPMAAR
jgi:hypothetical protein